MREQKKRTGFTIIELSLSLAFISVLSIAVMLIISGAVSAYRRGITLNQINTLGMDLTDEIRATVQNSPSRSIKADCDSLFSDTEEAAACNEDGGYKFVFVKKEAEVEGVTEAGKKIPVWGAFCTGAYSYIWNSGYFWTDKKVSDSVGRVGLKYTKKENGESAVTTHTDSDFKLLKVHDEQRAVCISALNVDINNEKNAIKYTEENPKFNSSNFVFDITPFFVLDEEPVDVISKSSESNLVVYDLDVVRPVEDSSQNDIFYSASFILGTVQGGIDVKTDGNYCAVPNDYANENFDYCSINKFNFAAQAIGG